MLNFISVAKIMVGVFLGAIFDSYTVAIKELKYILGDVCGLSFKHFSLHSYEHIYTTNILTRLVQICMWKN